MRLGDIMKQPVETIEPNQSVAVARERMRRMRIHHLVVVEGRDVRGVVSERDLRAVDDGRSVAEAMSHGAVTAPAHTTLRQAANLLRGRAIGCIPIVDGGRLLGVVTIADVLELVGRGVERPVEQGKRWTLKHRGPRRGKRPA
jgi:acetoin utilization protein AcuB